MLIRNALGAGNLLAFIEILLMVSRSKKIEWLTGREVNGQQRNFANFQSLSLLVDTCGGFKAAKIEILILDDYSVELEIRNNCLVLVLLNAGIFCTLMQWYSVYCTI